MSSRNLNINDAYFEWMYVLACGKRNSEKRSFRKLLRTLHDREFTYMVPMDGNRAEDGIDLRYRFGEEESYEAAVVTAYLDERPCSILEMMIALAIRCEEHIMDDPDIGDRTGTWFWKMIDSLGLSHMNDRDFDRDYVDRIISKFLNRKYRRNGEGGLFTVHSSRRDLRNVEIWYQAMWYLGEVLKN